MPRGRPRGGSNRVVQGQRAGVKGGEAAAFARAAAAHPDAGDDARAAEARVEAAAATRAVTAAAPCGAAAADAPRTLPLASAPHAAFTNAGNGVNACIGAHLVSLYEHESGLCYFVRGAPATCKYNMNPGRGVANGTICEAHSLHGERADVQADMLARIARAGPGAMLVVQPPTHVNVKPVARDDVRRRAHDGHRRAPQPHRSAAAAACRHLFALSSPSSGNALLFRCSRCVTELASFC